MNPLGAGIGTAIKNQAIMGHAQRGFRNAVAGAQQPLNFDALSKITDPNLQQMVVQMLMQRAMAQQTLPTRAQFQAQEIARLKSIPNPTPEQKQRLDALLIPSGGVTVNVGPQDIETATKTKLEKDIIELENNVAAFDEIEGTLEDSFLRLKGWAKAGLQKQAEIFGIPINAEFLGRRSVFQQRAQSAFLKWRKFITGVAGGPQELKEIAKSFPDPSKNSPTEFRAKLNSAREITRRAIRRMKILRARGIESPSRKDYATIPLNSTLLDGPAQPSTVAPITTADKVRILRERGVSEADIQAALKQERQ
jgi:hypothetical protein